MLAPFLVSSVSCPKAMQLALPRLESLRGSRHTVLGSLLVQWSGKLAYFENQPWIPLAAPPRTGLAAFGLAWRMLPKELPLWIQIRSSVYGVRWFKTISNF